MFDFMLYTSYTSLSGIVGVIFGGVTLVLGIRQCMFGSYSTAATFFLFAAIFLIGLVKILLNLLIRGTSTAGVGDLGNFLIGCAMCIPASLIYQKLHSRKGAIIGMVTGTVFMTIVGCFINAYLLLPAYAAAFHMPIDALVAMGTAVNSHINSLLTFVLLSVAPFNLLKGFLVSLIVFLIYKKISPILKMGRE